MLKGNNMPKLGRNDPCHCGSGRKYKQCHLPIEEAQRAEHIKLRRAIDTLMPKIVDHAANMPEQVALGFSRYWDGKYPPEQLAEIDEVEDRGADRFLTWFAFDYRQQTGQTLVEQLAADPGTLELTEQEAALLPQWTAARLRPYAISAIEKGQHIVLRDMLDAQEYTVEDHAASRRVLLGEVIVGHLIPAADQYYISGAVAHLTEDTREKLAAFMALHLEAYQRDNPGTTAADLIADRSEVLNHFVMQLPVEKPDPTLLDKILLQTKVALQLTGESLGLGGKEERAERAD
jgi:SEC-C motif